IQFDVDLRRKIGLVICCGVLALPAGATPKRLDLKKLVERPQPAPQQFIPARAGWNGPEQAQRPNPYLIGPATPDLQDALLPLLVPDWRVVLTIVVAIFLLRRVRRTTPEEQPTSYQQPPTDVPRAA
ncbi:MAG TPA: hypothetical protein VF135_15020, partial [Terriglobales bacterium]